MNTSLEASDLRPVQRGRTRPFRSRTFRPFCPDRSMGRCPEPEDRVGVRRRGRTRPGVGRAGRRRRSAIGMQGQPGRKVRGDTKVDSGIGDTGHRAPHQVASERRPFQGAHHGLIVEILDGGTTQGWHLQPLLPDSSPGNDEREMCNTF